mmetsp:Transcript_23855/g.52246  ORF Transcript_23855/g.52246 Transcript_23855/m.52246 type:complete len:298 (+) Transcript_23855:298-1191(+)
MASGQKRSHEAMGMSGETTTLDQVVADGDVCLTFPNGKELKAHKQYLSLASTVLRDMISECSSNDGNPLILKMDDSVDDPTAWRLVLERLYRQVLYPAPKLDMRGAYAMIPVIHKYNMKALLYKCIKEVQQASMGSIVAPASASSTASSPPEGASTGSPLQPSAPSTSGAANPAATSPPTLMEWLSLADTYHIDAIKERCMEQLRDQLTGAGKAKGAALLSGSSRSDMLHALKGLSAETLAALFVYLGEAVEGKHIIPACLDGRKHKFMQVSPVTPCVKCGMGRCATCGLCVQCVRR